MPEFPTSIFRYRPVRTEGKKFNDLLVAGQVHNEAKMIEKQSLWFSEFNNLNDPMEHYLNESSDKAICSFSTSAYNTMLWSLYAKNTGFCIEYDTELLLKHPNIIGSGHVKYLPRDKIESTSDIFTKIDDWRGEAEFRLVANDCGKVSYKTINNNPIKRVYIRDKFCELPNGNQCQNKSNFYTACAEIGVNIKTLSVENLLSCP